MQVLEAVAIATEWSERYAQRDRAFRGAHLMGGITRMSPEASFPADSDLDIGVLVDPAPPPDQEPLDELFRGALIEAGLRAADAYSTPAKVLANPEIADHVAAGAVLSDPHGLLAAIEPTVAREISRRRWVIARCEEERRRYQVAIDDAARTEVPSEFLLCLYWAVMDLAAVLSVALLVPPTHRRCFVQLRDQSHGLGRPELSEAALGVIGVSHLDRARVQSFADQAAAMFDRAVAVKRTRSPFDFKLKPHLRPYLIDGPQAMIDAGNHREVMPWIASGICVCAASLLNDAPAAERPRYAALAQDLIDELGMSSPAARAERLQLAAELSGPLFALADEIAIGRRD